VPSIVLGAAVDGTPESLIFGVSLATGAGMSAAFLAAVIISNIPQAVDARGQARLSPARRDIHPRRCGSRHPVFV